MTLIDNADVPIGGSFFGMGRGEVRSPTCALEAGRATSSWSRCATRPIGTGMGGINIGALAPGRRAISCATRSTPRPRADLSIVVVGTNDNWESEGWDRTTLDLPGVQDELVPRVAQVSPATVVVVNAGSPVTMPWLDDVHAVLMCVVPRPGDGQRARRPAVRRRRAAGPPAGHRSRSAWRTRPAFEHNPGRNGVANYLEGRLIGHRWYDTVGREPLFPFGFGLGYGCADIADVVATDAFTVECTVGERRRPRRGRGGAGVRPSAGPRRCAARRARAAAGRVRQGGRGGRLVAAGAPWRSIPTATAAGTSTRTPGPRRRLAYELRIGRSSRDIVARVEVRP